MDVIFDRQLETAPFSAIQRVADAAWRSMAAGLTGRSPFYRDKLGAAGVSLDEVGGTADLERLPQTTKDELRRSQEALPPFGSHLGVDAARIRRVYQTSGTSGRPNMIALTEGDLRTWTTIGARAYRAAGIHAHHCVVTTLGAGPYTAAVTHDTLDRLGAGRIPVRPGDGAGAGAALDLGIVDTLLTTTSFALYLAAADGDALPRPHLDRVIVGGEPGGGIPAIRRRLEGAFGASVHEVAGIGEVSPSLFAQCSESDGMHFCGQGLVWPELLDASGDPQEWESGATGELVYTSLVREAMPLLRFRSGDIARVEGTGCPCGRSSFRVRILGRADDMFIVRGVNVYPAAVQAVVAEFHPAVTGRVRVMLPAVGHPVPAPVPLEVETSGDPPSALADAIAEAIRRKLTFRCTVELLPPERFGDLGHKTAAVVRPQA